MLMISHAIEVPRSALEHVPTPDSTDSWRPVAHFEAVNNLIERAAARGLALKSERYALLPGTLYPRPGVSMELQGGKMFGSLDFHPVPGLVFPAGCTPSAGIRNSHDKSFALSILSGARVMLCANGVLSAEHVVSRKHTSGIDLLESIDLALDAFMQGIQQFNQTYEQLRGRHLTRTRSHSLVVELAQAGAIASSDILPLVEEYEHPRHLEFEERNAWSLYNAATETMKRMSPARQTDGFKALNAVLTAQLN